MPPVNIRIDKYIFIPYNIINNTILYTYFALFVKKKMDSMEYSRLFYAIA